MVSSVTRSYSGLQVEPPPTVWGQIPLGDSQAYEDLLTLEPNYIHRIKLSIIGKMGTAPRDGGFSTFRLDIRANQTNPVSNIDIFDYYDIVGLDFPLNFEFNLWAGLGRVTKLQARFLASAKTGYTIGNLEYNITISPYYRYEIVPPPQPERPARGTLQRRPGTSFLGTTKKILPVVRRPSAVWGALPLGT